jgi:hypothetical protein
MGLPVAAVDTAYIFITDTLQKIVTDTIPVIVGTATKVTQSVQTALPGSVGGLDKISDGAFQFLAIAIALASFLPGLVYSYAKGLVDEMDVSPWKDKSTKDTLKLPLVDPSGHNLKNEISFLYSVDLILTQAIMLVMWVAPVGIGIYLITIESQSPASMNCWTFVVAAWNTAWGLIVCGFTIKAFFERFNRSKERPNNWIGGKTTGNWLGEFWTGWKWAFGFWFVPMVSFWFLTVKFSLQAYRSGLAGNQLASVVENYNWILAIDTLMLVLAATVWILPLGRYNPLQHSISSKIEKAVQQKICEGKWVNPQ